VGLSLKKLWSAVNILQFLVYAEQLKISPPENLERFFEQVSFFARGDWIPKAQIVNALHIHVLNVHRGDKQGLQVRFLILVSVGIIVIAVTASVLVYLCKKQRV